MFSVLRWLKTIRHIPPRKLRYRLQLRAKRWVFTNVSPFLKIKLGLKAPVLKEITPEVAPFRLPIPNWTDFKIWQSQTPMLKPVLQKKAQALLQQNTAHIFSTPFLLPEDVTACNNLLAQQTPLWRENYGYFDFLLPLLSVLPSEQSVMAVRLIEKQFYLWQALPAKTRYWSTYAVSRRILSWIRLIPLVAQASQAFQKDFYDGLNVEAHWVAQHLEWDIEGNHLIKNLHALFAVNRLVKGDPSQLLWQDILDRHFVSVFSSQLLSDGMHFERVPMYHAWVFEDVIDCLAIAHADSADALFIEPLTYLANQMLPVLASWRHSSGHIPQFGDSALTQTPDIDLLIQYAAMLPSLKPPAALNALPGFCHFPAGGYAVMRHHLQAASLIIDCGDFGPKSLPAHSHCDIGSFEIYVGSTPIIVDSGISEYTPNAERQYFRSSAAHNTVWCEEEDQAALWSSFRVSAYPKVLPAQVLHTDTYSSLTVGYQNFTGHLKHLRTLYHLTEISAWILSDIVDWPLKKNAYTLLHLHPQCRVEVLGDVYLLGETLWAIPWGNTSMPAFHHKDGPWKSNLNLYSQGFESVQPGQLLISTPQAKTRSGWVFGLRRHGDSIPEIHKTQEECQFIQLEGQRLTLDWSQQELVFQIQKQS